MANQKHQSFFNEGERNLLGIVEALILNGVGDSAGVFFPFFPLCSSFVPGLAKHTTTFIRLLVMSFVLSL